MPVLRLAPVLLLALLSAQDAPLRRPLKLGDTESYASLVILKLDADLPNGMGKQDLTLDGAIDYKLVVGDPKGESSAVKVTTTVKKFDLGGTLSAFFPAPPIPEPLTQDGTLDARNRLRVTPPKASDVVQAVVASQVNAVSTVLVELPETAVKPGATWDVVIPKGPFTAPVDQKLTATWIGNETVEGVETYKVTLKGSLRSEVDGSQFGGANVSSKGTATVDGVANLDPLTGRTVKLVQRFTTASEVDPGQGFTVKIAGNGTITTTLAK